MDSSWWLQDCPLSTTTTSSGRNVNGSGKDWLAGKGSFVSGRDVVAHVSKSPRSNQEGNDCLNSKKNAACCSS
jgi:hypothetical protein